jgi:hypothetical protein
MLSYASARSIAVALSLADHLRRRLMPATSLFAIKNSHSNAMRVELYSQDRDHFLAGQRSGLLSQRRRDQVDSAVLR